MPFERIEISQRGISYSPIAESVYTPDTKQDEPR